MYANIINGYYIFWLPAAQWQVSINEVKYTKLSFLLALHITSLSQLFKGGGTWSCVTNITANTLKINCLFISSSLPLSALGACKSESLDLAESGLCHYSELMCPTKAHAFHLFHCAKWKLIA